MALKLYTDALCTSEITELAPDTIRQAVTSGNTLTREDFLYVKSDNVLLTYENISITAINDDHDADASGEVEVFYAPDVVGVAGTYVETLDLSDGVFTTALKFWRRATAPSVTAAFNDTTIQHQIVADEYVL